MSEELNVELTKLISKAAIDGTLSESAVKQFTGVLEENKDLIHDIEVQNKDLGETQGRMIRAEERVKMLEAECETWAGKEQDLLDRESQAEVLAMTVKYEQKRVEDHKSMVGLIFRNTLLRNQVVVPGHAGTIDQYGSRQGEQYPTTHDVETKEE